MTMKEVLCILGVGAVYALYKVHQAETPLHLDTASLPSAALPNTSQTNNPAFINLPTGGVAPQ